MNMLITFGQTVVKGPRSILVTQGEGVENSEEEGPWVPVTPCDWKNMLKSKLFPFNLAWSVLETKETALPDLKFYTISDNHESQTNWEDRVCRCQYRWGWLVPSPLSW